MNQLSTADLRGLFNDDFAAYRDEDWAREWRANYAGQVRKVQQAEIATWLEPSFQERLWDAADISGIGPGQSVTLVAAYLDEDLARLLFEARGSLDDLGVEDRGRHLQALFDVVLGRLHPRYAARRPKARLVRLLAAMFPRDMTCLMDASRVFGVQRLLGAPRLQGGYVAQHPGLREKVRDAIGPAGTPEEEVDLLLVPLADQGRSRRRRRGCAPARPARGERSAPALHSPGRRPAPRVTRRQGQRRAARRHGARGGAGLEP